VNQALPPGPRVAAYQTLRYMRDPHGRTAELERRYGTPFTLPTVNGTLVLTTTPDGAREILAGREEDFVVGFGVEALRVLVGEGGLLLLSGDAHRRERKLLSPTFHGARMRAYGNAVVESTLREAATWATGRQLNAQQSMQSISIDVILRAVFGVQSGDRRLAFREAIRLAVDEVSPAPIFFDFLRHEFGGFGPWARFKRHKRAFDALIYQQIAEARRDPQEREDVLHRLVAARYDDGRPLPDDSIRDHLLTLLVAGHETTATTLAWSFAELAQHPEIVAHLRDDLAALGADPAPDEVSSLPYLDAFCREILRAHPIVAEFFRTVKTSFELQGWQIPAGISVAASILRIHRDPTLYPDPDRFRPERFLERRFAPHEFAAFGGGHRHCIGAAFAMNELKLVLGTLVPLFDWRLTENRPPRTILRHVTLGPERGCPIVLGRRLSQRSARAA